MSYISRQGNRNANRVGATVSRRLRGAGVNVSPSGRKDAHNGLFVSAKDDFVTVLVDLGTRESNIPAAMAVLTEIRGWAQVDIEEIAMDVTDGVVHIWFTYQRTA